MMNDAMFSKIIKAHCATWSSRGTGTFAEENQRLGQLLSLIDGMCRLILDSRVRIFLLLQSLSRCASVHLSDYFGLLDGWTLLMYDRGYNYYVQEWCGGTDPVLETTRILDSLDVWRGEEPEDKVIHAPWNSPSGKEQELFRILDEMGTCLKEAGKCDTDTFRGLYDEMLGRLSELDTRREECHHNFMAFVDERDALIPEARRLEKRIKRLEGELQVMGIELPPNMDCYAQYGGWRFGFPDDPVYDDPDA